jgi:hypothetical protein
MLENTLRFGAVNILDPTTVTASQLEQYDDVLVWNAETPPVGLGDTLATYYYSGNKHLTIASFSFSNLGAPFFLDLRLTGAIAASPYAAFVNSGATGMPDGALVETVPTDPIFQGVDLSALRYYSGSGNFANPTLASGATLLATDGSGLDMIARSENGIIDLNFYPGDTGTDPNFDNNATLFQLIANSFPASGGGSTTAVPEPSALAWMAMAALGIAGKRRRRG